MHINIKVTEGGESVRECVLAAKNKESESEREDKRGSNQSDKVISLHLLLSLSLSSSGLIIQSGLDLCFSCPMHPSDEYYIVGGR